MHKKRPFNIILLGDPASGKGTQSAILAKKYHLYDFDMGKEVRQPSIRKKFDYEKTTGAGKLTPTAIVRKILKHKVVATPASKGMLFNGHPKMIGEARLLAGWLKKYKRTDPIVLYLHVPASETLRRAKTRRVYYHGRWVVRSDDSGEALMNRRKYYREQVSHVIAFFKARYSFRQISGMGTEAQVTERLTSAIEKMLQKARKRS